MLLYWALGDPIKHELHWTSNAHEIPPEPTVFLSYSSISVLDVDSFPRHSSTDTKEVPQVAYHPSVKRVVLRVTVFEVRDAVLWHELPRGGVNGRQVHMDAQQK